MLFISARSLPVGGGVGPIKILDRSNAIKTISDVGGAIYGRDVLLVTHGFNVNQLNGMQSISNWAGALQIGNAAALGLLWPGDSSWMHGLDYPVEGGEATSSANAFAAFINANFSAALSVSFASHSLGARVALQTISGLTRTSVRRLLLMAGAIDNTCLTGEYANAAAKVQSISVLASRSDEVLKWAFPTGNFVQGLFSRGAPYVHEALGREGPAQPYPDPNNIHADWQVPDSWAFGHGSYLPASPLPAGFPLPVSVPPGSLAPTPPGAPAPAPEVWQPAWSAAFESTRFP